MLAREPGRQQINDITSEVNIGPLQLDVDQCRRIGFTAREINAIWEGTRRAYKEQLAELLLRKADQFMVVGDTIEDPFYIGPDENGVAIAPEKVEELRASGHRLVSEVIAEREAKNREATAQKADEALPGLGRLVRDGRLVEERAPTAAEVREARVYMDGILRGNVPPHAFERKRSSRWEGPADETCEICGKDPRNALHEAHATPAPTTDLRDHWLRPVELDRLERAARNKVSPDERVPVHPTEVAMMVDEIRHHRRPPARAANADTRDAREWDLRKKLVDVRGGDHAPPRRYSHAEIQRCRDAVNADVRDDSVRIMLHRLINAGATPTYRATHGGPTTIEDALHELHLTQRDLVEQRQRARAVSAPSVRKALRSDRMRAAIRAVMTEAERAREKHDWSVERTTDDDKRLRWMVEEVGEIAEALELVDAQISATTYASRHLPTDRLEAARQAVVDARAHVLKEVTQVAALALRWLANDTPPERKR